MVYMAEVFINLQGESVKMQFCCSLAFPRGQRSAFSLCWVRFPGGGGCLSSFVVLGLQGEASYSWTGWVQGGGLFFFREMHNYQTTRCHRQLHNPKILFIMSIKKHSRDPA